MYTKTTMLAVPVLAILALTANSPAAPAPGPGAVIAMHKAMFRAIDGGDLEGALGFLHADMDMDRDYGQRPCTLFLVGDEGAPVSADGFAASNQLLADWLDSGASGWKTRITSAHDNCLSGELSYAVLEFERTRATKLGTETRRYRSTSLVTYDEGWKITHWHVSPAGPTVH